MKAVVALAGALALFAGSAAIARKPVFDGPGNIAKTRSLFEAIEAAHRAGGTLHIIFIHGIRAEGPGESAPFAKKLAAALNGRVGTAQRHTLDLGLWPRNAAFFGPLSEGGIQIWRTSQEWQRSQPFVERSLVRAAAGDVVIDELNYWPLLFPLKCRFLLEPEHDLSGNDVAHLKLCHQYGWLTDGELAILLSTTPKSGGGAKINAILKQQIMNWGLSDAVMALGSMRGYFSDTVEKAFDFALDGQSAGQEYVVVSESLGSFVVLDAYAANRQPVVDVLDRTADLYFFANQFALLELARIDGLSQTQTGDDRTAAKKLSAPSSPITALRAWAVRPGKLRSFGTGTTQPKQIVAFSDPSDLLTYRVPRLDPVEVVNVYVRNQASFLGLFANPVSAHVGHVNNRQVWDVLMRRSGK